MDKMKRQVIELVRNVVNKYALTTIPTFDEICSGLGLDVKVGELPTGIDGSQKDKTIIINSRIRNEERKRFTQFHEVTHYLLNKDGHLISELHDLTFSKKDEYNRQLEKFCNIGAAEFLMPSKEFTKLYEEKGFNVQLIPFAAKHFRSSTIAATIQLAQVAPNKCIAVICEKGLIPNDKVSSKAPLLTAENQSRKKPKLHVVYSASSPAASNRWLAKYTVFPDDHIINQAFLQSKMLEGECDIPFPSWQESHPCEALPYKNRVYALFHLSPLPNSNQMSLFNGVTPCPHLNSKENTTSMPTTSPSPTDPLKQTKPVPAILPAKTTTSLSTATTCMPRKYYYPDTQTESSVSTL